MLYQMQNFTVGISHLGRLISSGILKKDLPERMILNLDSQKDNG